MEQVPEIFSFTKLAYFNTQHSNIVYCSAVFDPKSCNIQYHGYRAYMCASKHYDVTNLVLDAIKSGNQRHRQHFKQKNSAIEKVSSKQTIINTYGNHFKLSTVFVELLAMRQDSIKWSDRPKIGHT